MLPLLPSNFSLLSDFSKTSEAASETYIFVRPRFSKHKLWKLMKANTAQYWLYLQNLQEIGEGSWSCVLHLLPAPCSRWAMSLCSRVKKALHNYNCKQIMLQILQSSWLWLLLSLSNNSLVNSPSCMPLEYFCQMYYKLTSFPEVAHLHILT